MKSFDGYLKLKLGNDYVLLAGGSHKPLSEFFIKEPSDNTHTIYSKPSGIAYTGYNLSDAPVTGWISGIVLGSDWNNNHFLTHLVLSGIRWYTTNEYENSLMKNWKTFAYLSDLPTKSSWNYDDVYLKLIGGTLIGDLYFNKTNPLIVFSGTPGGGTGNYLAGDASGNIFLAANKSGNKLYLESTYSAAPYFRNQNGDYTIYHSGNLPAYPTKASWNYDDVYVKKIGDIMTGTLHIKNGTDYGLNLVTTNNTYTRIRFFNSAEDEGAVIHCFVNYSSSYPAVKTFNLDAGLDWNITLGNWQSPTIFLNTHGNLRVGIGTISPAYKLDVNGVTNSKGITLNGASSSNVDSIDGIAGNINFGGNFHIDAKGNYHTYINHYTNKNVFLCSGSSQGSVGIGNASPAYKLDVTGAIRANGGNLIQRGSVDTGVYMYSTDGTYNVIRFFNSSGTNTGYIHFFYSYGNATNHLNISCTTGGAVTLGDWTSPSMYVLSNGNKYIGMGTSSPIYKLDVVGTIHGNGDVLLPMTRSAYGCDDIASVPISGACLASTHSDQASFRTALKATKSYIGSTTGWNGWLNVISCRHRNGGGDGNMYGMYIRTHLTNTTDNLYWDRETYGSWQGERTILDTGNYTSYLGYIGTTAVLSSPATLDLTGIGNITGVAGRIAFGGNWHFDTLNGYALYMNHYNATNIYMCTGGGSVGIGTASPGAKLHVTNHMYVSGTSDDNGIYLFTSGGYNVIRGGTAASSTWCAIHMFNTAYGGYSHALHMINITGDKVSLGTWTNPELYLILSTRCIGIRTTSPSYPLHVNGDCAASNFYTTSDARKKLNISSFSEHIRKFQLKDTEKWHYGVIAQEVEEMFRDGEEGNMTVNYNSVLSFYIGLLENRVKMLEDKLRKYEEIQNI